MFSGLRALLFWLLLVALPLHGVAIGASRSCGGMTTAVSQIAAASGAHAEVAATMLSTSARTALGSSSVCVDMTASDQQPQSPATLMADCVASAVCSIVAAATVPRLEMTVSLPASAPPVSRPASAAGFLTDAPDRPPRVFA